MKRILLTLLALTLFLFAISSCAQAKKLTNPWEDPTLSERDAAIREVSDVALMQKHGFDVNDLSFYKIAVNTTNKGGYVVYYKLCFFGYDTMEHYWVNVSSDYQLEAITENELGTYSKFLSHITEEAVKSAESKLDEQLKSYEVVSEKFLCVDDSGNLCLTVEAIEYLDPPLADEKGNTEGCGLDHNHILLIEIICHAQ